MSFPSGTVMAMRLARIACSCFVLAWLALAAPRAEADSEVIALWAASGALILANLDATPRDEHSHLAFEVGQFDAVRNADPAAAGNLEYRLGDPLVWRLRPFAGIGVTTDQSFYGYAGIRVPTWWGEHVVATPSFAIGGYHRGKGKNLGTPAVIGRFGIDLEYRLDNDLRVGVAYHHMSNGKALGQDINPGTEVVGLTLSVPMP
jgi:hypothetical protein